MSKRNRIRKRRRLVQKGLAEEFERIFNFLEQHAKANGNSFDRSKFISTDPHPDNLVP